MHSADVIFFINFKVKSNDSLIVFSLVIRLGRQEKKKPLPIVTTLVTTVFVENAPAYITRELESRCQ